MTEYMIMAVVWALVCYQMAVNRGRSPILGIAGGLAFGLGSVIYYWVAGDTEDMRDVKFIRKVKLARENMETELPKETE